MKLTKIGLAIILSLVLLGLICPAVQADENEAEVDLSATVALTISNVSASSIGYHSATISWETNGDATSQVFYDIESRASPGDYADSTTEEITRVTEHSTTLTGLSSSTTYHYRVRSAVPDTKFIAISEDYTFRTLTPAVGGGGAAAPAYYLDTDLFGIEESYRISRGGELRETIEAASADGMVTIAVPKGTVVLDKDGERLEILVIAVDETPPTPPEDSHIIGLTYSFQPEGATFDPPISLPWSYDPEALPQGVAEEDLVVAYYDQAAGEWVECECICDPETHCITACICHFTCFAIIGAITPPPPPAPAAFSIRSLNIFPGKVDIGETTTISILVTNTGGQSGSYKVTLKINGVVEATKEVTVHAGFSKEVTFTISKDIAGIYSVDVDGLTGSFTVTEKPVVPVVPKPVNWPLIGGIIAVVIVGLLIFFFTRRKAA